MLCSHVSVHCLLIFKVFSFCTISLLDTKGLKDNCCGLLVNYELHIPQYFKFVKIGIIFCLDCTEDTCLLTVMVQNESMTVLQVQGFSKLPFHSQKSENGRHKTVNPTLAQTRRDRHQYSSNAIWNGNLTLTFGMQN